jgi:high-affinity iron transporter
VFNAVLGWTNSASYGSVISYNLYWLAVIIAFVVMRYNEVKGHWPLMKAKAPKATGGVGFPREKHNSSSGSGSSEENVTTLPETAKVS